MQNQLEFNIEDGNDLIDNLQVAFQDIRENKKAQFKINDVLSEKHKIPRGTLNKIMVRPDSIEEHERLEIAAFVQVLYDETQNHIIDPKKFFKESELKKAKNYKRKNESFEYPYSISGVLKASDTEYVAILSAQEIADMWNNELLTYNYQSQRLSKRTIRRDGSVKESPDVKMKSVKKITKLMLEGRYKSNALLFNILVDGNDDVEYEDGELIINEGTTCNLIDGMHRVQAMLSALEADPDFNYNFAVVIRQLPLTEAQDMLSQVNTTNPFNKTLAKFYGSDKLSAQVARELMNIPELKDRISINTSIGKKFNYLTNFAVLSESIEAAFAPTNNKERYDAVDTLKRFFGYLINHYEKEFVLEVNETKEVSWINHHNIFAGYIVLAKNLYNKYGKDFPVDSIVKVIESIDFSKKEGLPFNDVISPQGKVNSNKIKKDIREFFEGIEV